MPHACCCCGFYRKISPADLQLLNMAYTPVADRARHSDGDDLADVSAASPAAPLASHRSFLWRTQPAASEDSTLLSTPAAASLAWTDGSATARPDEPALIIPPRRASVALQMDAVPTDAANSVALMSEFTARGCIDISVYLSSACVAAAIKKRQLKERRAQSIFEAHASGPAERRALVGFRAFATATGEALAAASEEPQSEEPDPVAAEEVQGPVPKQDPEPEVDAPLELLQAFHELSERTARETDGSKDGVSFAALQQWVPLQEAVSEGLLSVPEMATSLRLVRGADETSVADRLVEHLSLREFVELALVLQQSIDRAISAQTASGAHDAAAAEGAFDIDGYSNRRLDEFISDAAGSTRRRSLSISRSVSAEKDGNMPSFAPDAMAADDGLASHILPHLKTCMGNLYKQGHRVKNWKLRRFVLSGLRLSYYSGKVQKGEFSLKGERCEVIAGQAAPDTSGRVAVTAVSESIGMHPFSFTIVNHDLGRFLNLYAESSADLQKWVDAVSFNVRLSQSLLAGGDAPVAPASETASLSAPEDRPAAVVAPDAPSVGSLDGVYASLLRSGEHVCMAGEVVKRNKFTRMQEVRHLVLITPPR